MKIAFIGLGNGAGWPQPREDRACRECLRPFGRSTRDNQNNSCTPSPTSRPCKTSTAFFNRNGGIVKSVYESPARPPQARCCSTARHRCRHREVIARPRPPAAWSTPVSGGIAAANGGTLTFMVGTEKAFARAKVLEAMGKAVIHAGDTGAGQTAICNNMLPHLDDRHRRAMKMAEKLGSIRRSSTRSVRVLELAGPQCLHPPARRRRRKPGGQGYQSRSHRPDAQGSQAGDGSRQTRCLDPVVATRGALRAIRRGQCRAVSAQSSSR